MGSMTSHGVGSTRHHGKDRKAVGLYITFLPALGLSAVQILWYEGAATMAAAAVPVRQCYCSKRTHRALHAAADDGVTGAQRGTQGHHPATRIVVVVHAAQLGHVLVVQLQRVVPASRQYCFVACTGQTSSLCHAMRNCPFLLLWGHSAQLKHVLRAVIQLQRAVPACCQDALVACKQQVDTSILAGYPNRMSSRLT